MRKVVTLGLGLGLCLAVAVGVTLRNERVSADQRAAAAQGTSTPWVSVQDSDGQPLMEFAAQATPFRPGIQTRVREEHRVRAADGRTITGFAYYGWTEGASVRVIVLAQVPAAQAEPTSFPGDPDSPGTRLEQVAQFTLAVGESRRVDELKAFGGAPMIVKALTRR